MKGKRFFDSEGNYFPVKGIAYYPRPNDGDLQYSNSVDLFTNEYRQLWEQDIAHFVDLGINVVRIYAVDPSQPHDDFMCALQAAGIYVIVGLLADCENCAVGIEPAPTCYPERLKNRGQWIINVFSKYTNTLAFSAGNEATIFAAEATDNAPCQKKFLRDMRAFIQKCRKVPASILPRDIPVGMVNWDYQRDEQTLYFNCRTNSSDIYEEAEWYGLNAYHHCNQNVKTVEELEGWQKLREDFTRYNLPSPVIFAEYGCRGYFPSIGEFQAQRDWLQVDALYSPAFTDVFAGGVVFEYSAEKRQADGSRQQTPWPYYAYTEYQFGVGYYAPVDCDHTSTYCEYNRYPEFDVLAAKYASVDVSFVPAVDDYVPTGSVPQCPVSEYRPVTDFIWPSDTSPDEWCYVVGTEMPTGGPAATAPTDAPVATATTMTTAPPVSTVQPTALRITASPTPEGPEAAIPLSSSIQTTASPIVSPRRTLNPSQNFPSPTVAVMDPPSMAATTSSSTRSRFDTRIALGCVIGLTLGRLFN